MRLLPCGGRHLDHILGSNTHFGSQLTVSGFQWPSSNKIFAQERRWSLVAISLSLLTHALGWNCGMRVWCSIEWKLGQLRIGAFQRMLRLILLNQSPLYPILGLGNEKWCMDRPGQVKAPSCRNSQRSGTSKWWRMVDRGEAILCNDHLDEIQWVSWNGRLDIDCARRTRKVQRTNRDVESVD